MRVVISFPLRGGVNRVALPPSAVIVKLTLKKYTERGFDAMNIIRDREALALLGWAIVDAGVIERNDHTKDFIVVGTARPIPDGARYIDSVMFDDEKLALHLFEI
jgi:hypothetical protein